MRMVFPRVSARVKALVEQLRDLEDQFEPLLQENEGLKKAVYIPKKRDYLDE